MPVVNGKNLSPSTGKDVFNERSREEFNYYLQSNYDKPLSHSDVTYTKKLVGVGDGTNASAVQFVYADKELVSVVWKTSAENIKKGVRFGIVSPESLTGKVNAALGKYRIVLLERISHGEISKAQNLKSELLNFYQDLIEKLAPLESMVNQDNSVIDYKAKFSDYLSGLQKVAAKINETILSINSDSRKDKTFKVILQKLFAEIAEDKKVAEAYLASVTKDTTKFNRARGNSSVLTFVKNQLRRHLYAMSGLNQHLVYSYNDTQPLTRGALYNCVCDAKKVIDDFEADPKNAVLPDHHMDFSQYSNENLAMYDLTDMSVNNQRQALLAISFIEGDDEVAKKDGSYVVRRINRNRVASPKNNPLVECVDDTINELGIHPTDEYAEEPLKEIIATNTFYTQYLQFSLRRFFYELWNSFKGFFVETTPVKEAKWNNPDFKLKAEELRELSKKKISFLVWMFNFVKFMFQSVFELVYGFFDTLINLFIQLIQDIRNDWASTRKLETLVEVLGAVESEINEVNKLEEELLKKYLESAKILDAFSSHNLKEQSAFNAVVPYHLTPGDRSDILTAITRWTNEFSNVFAQMYVHDPIVGLALTSTLGVGALVVFAPVTATKIFGPKSVKWLQNIVYSIGVAEFLKSYSLTLVQSNLYVLAWNKVIYGSSSGQWKLINDAIREAFKKESTTSGRTSPKIEKIKVDSLSDEQRRFGMQLKLIVFLMHNSHFLLKIDKRTLFALEQQIFALFSYEKAQALKKLLLPERTVSIVRQIIAIPIAYLAHILRVVSATFLSLTALILRRDNILSPMIRALGDMWCAIKKDLSRILIALSKLIQTLYYIVSAPVKALFDVFNMLISRVSAKFGANASSSIHKFTGNLDVNVSYCAEAMYPERITENVEVAHPMHVVCQTFKNVSARGDYGFFKAPQNESKSNNNARENFKN